VVSDFLKSIDLKFRCLSPPKLVDTGIPYIEIEKYYKQLTKKTEKLTNSLYQVTEFTIEALDYMLEATQGMGMEIKLNKAYHYPGIVKSKSEIVSLYGFE
jgi:hypothetical protein